MSVVTDLARLSAKESMNAKVARAWSGVRAKATNSPAGGTSRKDEANSETSRRSFCLEDSSSSSGTESKQPRAFGDG